MCDRWAENLFHHGEFDAALQLGSSSPALAWCIQDWRILITASAMDRGEDFVSDLNAETKGCRSFFDRIVLRADVAVSYEFGF